MNLPDRQRTVQKYKLGSPDYNQCNKPKEPILMLLSKTIRAEAGYLYYRHVSFDVSCRGNTLPYACDWIRERFALGACPASFKFHVKITQLDWGDLRCCLALAKLIYGTDKVANKENKVYKYWRRRILASSRAGVLKHVLEIIWLSVAVRSKGGTLQELERCFRGWAVLALIEPGMWVSPTTKGWIKRTLGLSEVYAKHSSQYIEQVREHKVFLEDLHDQLFDEDGDYWTPAGKLLSTAICQNFLLVGGETDLP